MAYFYWIAGTILGLAWFSRIVDAALGMPSVADVSLPEWDRNPVSPAGNPRVSIIVPARNEEETIEQALNLLLALDYDNYEVIAVNDRSTDSTGEIMVRVSQSPRPVPAKNAGTRAGHPSLTPNLRVIHHRELPPGWLGKTHAMWTAAQQADGDWLLFTDADVLFKPDSLRRALAYAESVPADHVVLFPRMIMKRPGEFMMKKAGFAQRNVFGRDLISIRWAHGAMGVVENLTKNFFAVLSFQAWRTVISAFGLAFLNFGPFLGVWLAHGWARVPYGVALGSMFLIYLGMSWRSAVPAYYFLLHPVSTALFIYTLLRSMALTLWNDGIVWRGTRYPLEELRKGMV